MPTLPLVQNGSKSSSGWTHFAPTDEALVVEQGRIGDSWNWLRPWTRSATYSQLAGSGRANLLSPLASETAPPRYPTI